MSRAVLLALVYATAGFLRAEVSPMDMRPFEQRAANVFSPAAVAGDGSRLLTTCDQILLVAQGIAATIVVAGLLFRLRRDDAPFDGIATTMLKVAFIATVPFWRAFTLETPAGIGDAAGYQPITLDGTSSPTISRTWQLLAEWVPPGSPYLDALDAQSGTATPATGEEAEWGVRAWNWARGVGVASESQFQWLWQSFSGGLRAVIVFTCCALCVCAVSLTLMVAYFSELLRLLAFNAGCALVPIFIAGLGVDALRAQSVRFIFGVAAVALWPVGWGLANIVTEALLDGSLTWMREVSTAALSGPGLPAAPLAVAAPYLGWGALFLFAALTVGLCLWIAGVVLLVPVLFGRAVTTGTTALSSVVTNQLTRFSSESPSRGVRNEPLLIRPGPALAGAERLPSSVRAPSESAATIPLRAIPPTSYRPSASIPLLGFSGPSSDASEPGATASKNFKSRFVT